MLNRFGAAAVAALALSLTAGSAFAACNVGIFATLPVTMQGLRPLVPAKINGVEVQLAAESGAFFSSIEPSVAKELKLQLSSPPEGFKLQGIGGETEIFLTKVKTFTLDTSAIPNVEFMVAPGAGGTAAGLLGQNVLGLADVEYDLAHGAIRLIRPTGCGQAPLAYWAVGKPYSVMDIKNPAYEDQHTIGEATVNGVKLKVLFDTGGTSMMTRGAAQRAGIKLDAPGIVNAGLSSGIGRRAVRSWIAPVASFKIGNEEIQNTKLRVGDFTFSDYDMLLGADFFLSHRIYVSNSQHKLYFTYNGGPVFNLTAGPPPTQAADQDAKAPPPAARPDDEPKDADGFSRRGAAFAARRDYEHAIADFTRAIEMAPNEAKYYYARATARNANRQPFLGMADLDQALKLTPNDLQALMVRANLRIGGHDIPGATSDLETAARLMPKESDLHMSLAGLYERADLYEPAIAQYDQWITAHPDDGRLVQALNGRCWTRALAGRELDKALNDCDRAIRANPKTAAFLDSRGLVHLRMGDNDKAIADYDAALALNPKIAWSLYGRGLAKQRKGMKPEGQADMTAGIAIQASLPADAKRYRIDPPG